MICSKLVNPKSIIVVGGSDDLGKIGGRVLRNLLNKSFSGELFVLNPKKKNVQNIKTYKSPKDIKRAIDVAVLAIPAKFCLEAVKQLIDKDIVNFIILSAGFKEENKEGKILEEKILKEIEKVGGNLIGPNCIGVMNTSFQAVFTPVFKLYKSFSCDLISASGATAVFLMSKGIKYGLRFSSMYNVGNAAQISVEDVLAYLDKHFDSKKSAKVKLLYFESIKKPKLLLKHATSLIQKGCKIAAIKAGKSKEGEKAASSHTGALSNPYLAVKCLLKKAGIISCNGREELINTAKILMNKELKGRNIAIISNAGGPAVMLTDVLAQNGFKIPCFDNNIKKKLANNLFPGSSVNNPIDLMATGTSQQLNFCVDICKNKLDNINGICIIFGNPGLFSMQEVFNLIDSKIKSSNKPIYVVLPSNVNSNKEIKDFIAKGNVVFDDEVLLGKAMARFLHLKTFKQTENNFTILQQNAEKIIKKYKKNDYLKQGDVYKLLKLADIEVVDKEIISSQKNAINAAKKIGFPIVMKALGILHKTEKNALSLNINKERQVVNEFNRLIKMQNVYAVEITKMLDGIEFFIGVKKEQNFGHLLMCGMGGIYVEILKDLQMTLLPIYDIQEAIEMIRELKIYPLIKGYRGLIGFDENLAAQAICKISSLVDTLPVIQELDLNPLIGKNDKLVVVDARIKI